MQLFHNFSQKTIKVGEIFTTAKINLMHNDLTGVMRAGNGGLNTYGGKIQNNRTCLLSNASALLFFVVLHAEAVQANEDPSSFQNS